MCCFLSKFELVEGLLFQAMIEGNHSPGCQTKVVNERIVLIRTMEGIRCQSFCLLHACFLLLDAVSLMTGFLYSIQGRLGLRVLSRLLGCLLQLCNNLHMKDFLLILEFLLLIYLSFLKILYMNFFQVLRLFNVFTKF